MCIKCKPFFTWLGFIFFTVSVCVCLSLFCSGRIEMLEIKFSEDCLVIKYTCMDIKSFNQDTQFIYHTFWFQYTYKKKLCIILGDSFNFMQIHIHSSFSMRFYLITLYALIIRKTFIHNHNKCLIYIKCLKVFCLWLPINFLHLIDMLMILFWLGKLQFQAIHLV